MRVFITISYDGTQYLGSQIQKETTNTIFGQINAVLAKLGVQSKTVASGRTDRGVHATGQVFHVDLPPFWDDLEKLKSTLNDMLPASIQVTHINAVDTLSHARYSAKKRVYRYILKEASANPFQNNYITFFKKINFETIEKNIETFRGEYDFKFFMKTGSEITSSTRIIYKAFAYRYKDLIILNFEANGFLRSQIRLMVGALLGLEVKQIKEKLNCVVNHKVKPASANGLYLAKIKY
ncbi:MAG: tRNA pseudouridine(38-40) synthase TruA [Sulfurimonas sp.]